MYPVSEAYKNAIAQNNRNVRIVGTITLRDNTVINISDEDIMQGSLYFSEQCVSGEDIEVGNVYASEMGLSLNSPPENPYALDGARIVLNFGIETSDGVWEYVPLGYFYVTEIERKHTAVNLKALDGLILFDVDLSGVLSTGTPYALIESCCNKVGITLATSMEEFQDFSNGLTAFTIPSDSKIETCRDLLMWVCQLTGTFARMNRMGQLEIVPVKGGTSVKTIDRQQRFTSDVSDSYVKITKVAMKVGDVEYSQGTDGMTMVLEENPFLVGKEAGEINTILNNILNQVTQAEYIPYNVSFAGDPALQAGDYINLTGIKVFDKIRATFTRSSVAYLSDGTQVAANMPRLEQGRFGKAIMVEEGTTNLLQNPSFETGDLSNWSTGFGSGITGNINIVTNPTWHGNYAVKITITDSTSTSDASVKQNINVASGVTVTLSAYLLELQGNVNAELGFRCNNGSGGYQFLCKVFTTPGYCVYTATIPDGYFADMVWLYIKPRSVGGIGYGIFDAIQLEQKPYATSFIDGTRSPETLTIPTAGVLNPQEGTIKFWWCPINQPASTMTSSQLVAPPIIQVGNYYQNNSWILWCGIDSQLKLFVRGDNATGWTGQWTIIPNLSWYQLNRWYHIVVRWENANTFWIFIDGVKYGPYVSSQPFTGIAGNIMSLGRLNAVSGPSNALYDDLRISNRARTDEEIAAAYASGQPLPVDEWTTLKMNFDGSLSTITTVGDSIVTHSNWRYRGPHNIKAVGKSALVRGVQAQQNKSVSAVKTVAETAREIAQAANQSTQLIQDAITGYVLIRKNENTGSNEILIMDNPDPAQARKVWRWNMGGLGYSDNVVGVDNPAREYTVAMTMDGAINADFVRTGKLASKVVAIGPETTYEVEEVYTWQKYAGMTWQEVIDSLD